MEPKSSSGAGGLRESLRERFWRVLEGPRGSPEAPQERPRSAQERSKGGQKGIKNELRLSAGPREPSGSHFGVIFEPPGSHFGGILEGF